MDCATESEDRYSKTGFMKAASRMAREMGTAEKYGLLSTEEEGTEECKLIKLIEETARENGSMIRKMDSLFSALMVRST